MFKTALAVVAPSKSPRDQFLATHGPHPGGAACRPTPRLVGALGLWFRRMRERRELRRVAEAYPDYLLNDVGLRREDMLREAGKPFWRP